MTSSQKFSQVPIDLRSDTVTRPSPAMRQAMAQAEVGDDVFGEDPTVARLESAVAERFGHEAAMLTPSGIMATQTLLASLCPRGSELLCEANAHVVAYEAGAAAVIANVSPRTVDGDRGRLDVDVIEAALRPTMFPATPLGAISVEETTNRGGGAIHGVARIQALQAIAQRRSVPLHLDGARLFNAIVATDATADDYGRIVDALSICLSKGLGAPVGSVAVGSHEVIAAARVWRRRLGGDMRQAGVLAAAGLYALDHHVERLADDHANARLLAELLSESAGHSCVDPASVVTNMVYVDTLGQPAKNLVDDAASHGVLIGAMGPTVLRLVTHLDVSEADCRRAAAVLGPLLAAGAQNT